MEETIKVDVKQKTKAFKVVDDDNHLLHNGSAKHDSLPCRPKQTCSHCHHVHWIVILPRKNSPRQVQYQP
jgi:hypothetical protein